MPSANVLYPPPLVRQNPFYPGQPGVPGTDSETGLRQHSTGAVFYVDPNFPGVSDLRDGTNPTSPLQTVATALTKCQAYRGDVIAVMANSGWPTADGASYTTTIQESVTVDVAGVRIVGLFPSSPVGVPWGPAAENDFCITVSAMDVCIEGFAFTGGFVSGNGIYAEWGGGGTDLWADSLTVRHCWFDENIDTAIQLEWVWYADIHHNIFQECDEYGIYVDVAGSGIAYANIHHNWFQDCSTSAMWLRGCGASEIAWNTVYNFNAQQGNAATDEGITTEDGGQNMVHHNTLSCLRPGPGAGDYDDFCSADAAAPNPTDAWVFNNLLDGPSITIPAT